MDVYHKAIHGICGDNNLELDAMSRLISAFVLLVAMTMAVAADNNNGTLFRFFCTSTPIRSTDRPMQIIIKLKTGRQHISIQYIGSYVLNGSEVYSVSGTLPEHDANGADVVHWWGSMNDSGYRVDGYLHTSFSHYQKSAFYEEYISSGFFKRPLWRATCEEDSLL
jgi:hypothetical protein